MANPTWEETTEATPSWDDTSPIGNPHRANDILNKGVMYNASPEQSEAIQNALSPQDMEMETSRAYYKAKFGGEWTPDKVTQNILFEYGENATPSTANASNMKAAKSDLNKINAIKEAFVRRTAGGLAQFPQYVEDAKKLDQKLTEEFYSLFGMKERAKEVHGEINAIMPKMVSEDTRIRMRDWGKSELDFAAESQQPFMSGIPLEQSWKDGDWETVARDVGTAIAFELPNVASQIGLGIMSGGSTIPLVAMSAQATLQKSGELDDDASDVRKVVDPLLTGIVEGVSEKILGTGRIIDKAVTGKIKRGILNRLYDIGSEGASEGLASFGGNIINKAFGDDVKLSEGILMSTLVGAGTGVGTTTAFSLGDATRVRKQNTNEEIDTIVEDANIPDEQKPVMEEMLKTPTEQSTEAFNAWEPVSAEKVATDGAEKVAEPLDGIEDAPLVEISDRAQKALDIGEKIKTPFKKMASLTTRVKELAPKVKIAMDKADQKTHKIITANTDTIIPFAKSIKKVRKNVSKDEWKTVKAEILNGDWATLEARGIEGMAELRQMFQQTADSLGIKSIENYFRRKVKDYDGLIKHLGENPKGRFKKALDAKMAEKGKALTHAEKKVVIREALRVREGSGLGQKRTIDKLTPEMAEFYEDPLTELENYIRTSAQTIARKEMLGIDQGVSDELGEIDPSVTEDDIASIVAGMAEEGISRKDERELSELLKSHLEYKRAPKFVSALRRLVAVKYVTKIKTTVKQWGDFFVTMAENGVENTFGSANEAKNWSDEFGNEVELSLQEQGVEKLDAELQADKRKLIEEMIFKPLQSQDLLGKRILMRSTAMKWRRLAESNPEKLKKQLMKKFEHEEFVDAIIVDMKNKTLSEDVSFALYSQMADFHPISHSQHIKLYIDHPILRPLFMLKSFAFKRYDRLYREGISQVINGLAAHKAAAIDKDIRGRKDAASELASGILGVSRFMIFAVGGEMVIEKMYKEAMQALGFAPEEIPEDESWSSMYIQEASKIAPFIDPYALENAIERGDPMKYFDEAYDVPGPLGSDAVMDLIKHIRGTKDADVDKWKKDIPWFGELMWGAEQESRERKLMKKRKAQVKSKQN